MARVLGQVFSKPGLANPGLERILISVLELFGEVFC